MAKAPHRPRTIRFLLVVGNVALAVGVYGYLSAEPGPDAGRVFLTSNAGPVLFTHADHADRAEACVACHHDLAVDLVASCDDCHDEGEMEPDMVEHADLQAIDGHECDGCHEIAPDEDAEGCRECHEAAEIADVYHGQCNGCHLSVAADRFADADNQTRCEACHLK